MTNTATNQNAWWFYDGLGRTIQQQSQSATSGQIILANTVYTTTGQVWRASNPYAVTASGGAYQTPNWSQPYTEHQYDGLAREIKTTNPDATFQTMNYLQWATTITDANNHQRQSLADAFGRVVTVKEFNAGQTYTTDYAYNILNQLWQVQDAASPRNTTTMAYDKLGRKTAMTDPDLGTWSYAYDNVGNLTRQTDAKQQTTCMYYDALNRLKGKNYRSDTACPADPMSGYAVGYQYDQGANGIGRRTSMTYQSAAMQWNYDLQGRTTSQTDTLDGTPYTTSWTYDAMSRARTMTYPDGEVITTTYNTQGLPSTLSPYVTASSYSAASQVTTLTLGNGVTTNYIYNSQNLRLTQLTTSGGLQNLQYQYDNVGNIARITDTVRSETTNFTYDDLDRLLSASIAGVYSQGWQYNAIGNITQRTGVDAASFTYSTQHIHAATQVGSQTFGYDLNGNMSNRNGQTLTYDTENRLTQVISGTVTTQYVYNADGARVKKIVGGVATYYVGNYYEVTSSAVTKYYYFGAQRVAMKQGSTVTYLLSDHLGSTSVAVDATGMLQSRQTYYAFGGMRTSDVAPITSITDYSYTGQKLDSDGLMYYNARYYDAAIGRFLQPDSIIPNQFNPQSLNRYAYVRNNPVRYTDPTGQTCRFGREDCEAIAAAGLAGQTSVEPPAETQNEKENTYSPDVERALSQARGSPTARFYINYARSHRLSFAFTRVIDLRNPEGALTLGDTIFLDTRYETRGGVVGSCATMQICNYNFIAGKPIPPSILIHEIVHVIQNDTLGSGPNPWGGSLEREREAYTVGKTVDYELATSDAAKMAAKNYLENTVEANITNGIYVATPWSDQRYEQFREQIGGSSVYPPLLFPIR